MPAAITAKHRANWTGPTLQKRAVAEYLAGLEADCNKLGCYSITSSARARNGGNNAAPMLAAVFLLTAISKCVGCSKGMSAGRPPAKRRTTKSATRTLSLGQVRAEATTSPEAIIYVESSKV